MKIQIQAWQKISNVTHTYLHDITPLLSHYSFSYSVIIFKYFLHILCY